MAAPSAPTERWKPPLPPAVVERAKQAGRALGMPLSSVVLSFVVGAIIVLITGGNPISAYQGLICGGVGVFCSGDTYSSYTGAFQISEMLVFLCPLVLTGLSVAIAFRAGLFNIGAEGQLVMGAIATTFVGVHLQNLPSVILLPLVLIAGAAAGAIWGGIVGVLKALTGAHEVVTTIMLNYIALFFLTYLIVGGPMQEKGLSSSSAPISAKGRLPKLVPSNHQFYGLPGAIYRVHAGIFVALLAAALFAFIMKRTSLGYEIRAVGQSQRAARYAGISVSRTIIVTMLIAGAFGGLAGAVQIAGVRFQLTDIYGPDTTGFDAIAVSLLGQNTGIGVVLSGMLFAALDVGRNVMQEGASVSKNLADILQALILFSIAANFLRSLKLRLPSLRNVRGAESQVEPGVAAVATDTAPGSAVDAGASAGSSGE